MKIHKVLIVFALFLIAGTAFAQEARTKLVADLVLVGPHEDDGDIFLAVGSVTNIGSARAVNVEGKLLNVPSTWRIVPADPIVIGEVLPGETKKVTFKIVRGAEDETIAFEVTADNAAIARSSRVRVPINPLVFGGLIAAGAFTAYSLKARRRIA